MGLAFALLGVLTSGMGNGPQPAPKEITDLVSFDLAAFRARDPLFGATVEDNTAWQIFSRSVIERALAKYPASGIMARLNAVYVVRLLWWDKTYYGGTSTEDSKAIVLSDGQPGVDAVWMERAFHHEFAHILQYKAGHHFPRKAWVAANGSAFHYGYRDSSGAYDATAGGKVVSEDFDPKLNEQGVLSAYGATTFEEDWATYAENVLTDDSRFWALAAKNPRMAAKAQIMIDFYRQTFPGIHLHETTIRSAMRTRPSKEAV